MDNSFLSNMLTASDAAILKSPEFISLSTETTIFSIDKGREYLYVDPHYKWEVFAPWGLESVR